MLGRRESSNMPQITRFTSTKVQILTPEETQGARPPREFQYASAQDAGPPAVLFFLISGLVSGLISATK